MMKRLSTLNLAQFDTPMAAAAPDPRAEADQAYHLVKQMMASISKAYPAGALEWLEEHRHEDLTEAARLELEIDGAFQSQEYHKVGDLVDKLQRLYLRAWAAYAGQGGS